MFSLFSIQHEMFEIFNEETFEFDEKMYFLTEQFRNRRPKPITYQRNYNDWAITDIRIQYINKYEY